MKMALHHPAALLSNAGMVVGGNWVNLFNYFGSEIAELKRATDEFKYVITSGDLASLLESPAKELVPSIPR